MHIKNYRNNLVAEWEDIKNSERRKLKNAARKVSQTLRNRVRVNVAMDSNIEPLLQLLRVVVGDNLSAAFKRLSSLDQLSLREFAQSCR